MNGTGDTTFFIEMKLPTLFLSVLSVQTIALSDDEINSKWLDFQNFFSKSYRSHEELTKRFIIFKDNIRKIEAHNVRYEKGEVLHNEGVNQFADWTSQEFLEFSKKGDGTTRHTEVAELHVNNVNKPIPGFIDWRLSNFVTPVKDQGDCGSCWAFSTTGALEGQLARHRKGLISLSEQNLIDCTKSYGNDGCNGGYMANAFEYVKENGIEREEDYRYEADDLPCRFNKTKSVIRIKGYRGIKKSNEYDLTHALATVGPISAAISTSTSFQFYKSGILQYPSCTNKDLSHGVLIVGYGTERGHDYYIVKNSYGTTWGDEGYVKMARNRDNECGIASDANYPLI